MLPLVRTFILNREKSPELSACMSNQEIEGKRKKIEGQVRETVGKATDDRSEEIRGKGEQIRGSVEEEAGKAKRKLERH